MVVGSSPTGPTSRPITEAARSTGTAIPSIAREVPRTGRNLVTVATAACTMEPRPRRHTGPVLVRRRHCARRRQRIPQERQHRHLDLPSVGRNVLTSPNAGRSKNPKSATAAPTPTAPCAGPSPSARRSTAQKTGASPRSAPPSAASGSVKLRSHTVADTSHRRHPPGRSLPRLLTWFPTMPPPHDAPGTSVGLDITTASIGELTYEAEQGRRPSPHAPRTAALVRHTAKDHVRPQHPGVQLNRGTQCEPGGRRRRGGGRGAS